MPQPMIHETTFAVRYDECNAYGRVHSANLLRYMQEAAFNASAAAGYDLDRYNSLRTLWLIRETNIRLFHYPLTYGDEVTVKTYVLDFRRVRSRRAYHLRHTDSGAPIAEAYTDWVYIDADRERPITVPNKMIAAFFPNGHPDPADVPPREPFPGAPPPPPDAFAVRRRPEWRDIDGAHHVNNTIYIGYLEECALLSQQAQGWPLARLLEGGAGPLPSRYRIEYKQSALLGDELAIMTWGSDPTATGGTLHHTITRVEDDALLVRANVDWEWVDFRTRQPATTPQIFLDDFAKLTVYSQS